MNLLRQYRNSSIPPALLGLYSMRALQQIATGSLLGLFVPVYLYVEFGQEIMLVLCYYLALNVIRTVLYPPGLRLMNKVGIKRSIQISFPIILAYYAVLIFLPHSPLLLSGLAVFLLAAFCIMYWVPFHTDFAIFTNRKNRAKQISLLVSVSSLLSIVVPTVSGFLLARYGFNVVFLVGMGIILLAMIPLRLVPTTDEKYSWTYRQTWSMVFKRQNCSQFLTYFADGIEGFVSMVIWPIFIWKILEGDYLQVGFIASLIVLATVILRLIMGDLTDRFNKNKLLRYGATLYSAGWILKIFVTSAFHIFVVSTYHNFATILMRTPYNTLLYEKAADSGHYVDEYTVLREMYINIGRIGCIAVLMVLVQFFSLNITFIIAAIGAVLISLIPPKALCEEADRKERHHHAHL